MSDALLIILFARTVVRPQGIQAYALIRAPALTEAFYCLNSPTNSFNQPSIPGTIFHSSRQQWQVFLLQTSLCLTEHHRTADIAINSAGFLYHQCQKINSTPFWRRSTECTIHVFRMHWRNRPCGIHHSFNRVDLQSSGRGPVQPGATAD